MHRLGPTLILLFGLSQAARDVYLGSMFQGVGIFSVIALAFTISTLVFGTLAAVRRRADFAVLRSHWRTTLAMVVTTAFSWPFYFFALTYVDPSVANTIHSGMGPLTAIALALSGSALVGAPPAGRWEYACYAGIAATIVALWWVVLSGLSGVQSTPTLARIAGLAAVLVSGAAITLSLVFAKRLHDAGAGSEAVTSVRYLLLIAVAVAIELSRTPPPAHLNAANVGELAMATTVLMVLPLFALQVGIQHTGPMTAHVIRSLGPVFVFALEQVDARIAYSGPVLVCILAYSAVSILANIAHALSPRATAPKPG